MHRVALILCASLVLVACGKQATYMGMPVPGSPDNFTAFQDGVLGHGDVLLVITYDACGLCALADAAVITLYNQNKIAIKAYRINIDADAETAQHLGITKNDLIVKVNAAEQVIDRITTPDGAKLKTMVGL